MNYWIAEGRKKVHAIGACASVGDAVEAALIWWELARQSNPLINSMYSPFRTFHVVDERGDSFEFLSLGGDW